MSTMDAGGFILQSKVDDPEDWTPVDIKFSLNDCFTYDTRKAIARVEPEEKKDEFEYVSDAAWDSHYKPVWHGDRELIDGYFRHSGCVVRTREEWDAMERSRNGWEHDALQWAHNAEFWRNKYEQLRKEVMPFETAERKGSSRVRESPAGTHAAAGAAHPHKHANLLIRAPELEQRLGRGNHCMEVQTDDAKIHP